VQRRSVIVGIEHGRRARPRKGRVRGRVGAGRGGRGRPLTRGGVSSPSEKTEMRSGRRVRETTSVAASQPPTRRPRLAGSAQDTYHGTATPSDTSSARVASAAIRQSAPRAVRHRAVARTAGEPRRTVRATRGRPARPPAARSRRNDVERDEMLLPSPRAPRSELRGCRADQREGPQRNEAAAEGQRSEARLATPRGEKPETAAGRPAVSSRRCRPRE